MTLLQEALAPLPTDPTTFVAPDLAIGNFLATSAGFDAVVTLNLTATPAIPPVEEIRRVWPGNALPEFLDEVVTFATSHYQAGKRVLIRDYAGLNRCGLVSALVLVRTGMSVNDAIWAVHQNRSTYALCSPLYLAYLRGVAA